MSVTKTENYSDNYLADLKQFIHNNKQLPTEYDSNIIDDKNNINNITFSISQAFDGILTTALYENDGKEKKDIDTRCCLLPSKDIYILDLKNFVFIKIRYMRRYSTEIMQNVDIRGELAKLPCDDWTSHLIPVVNKMVDQDKPSFISKLKKQFKPVATIDPDPPYEIYACIVYLNNSNSNSPMVENKIKYKIYKIGEATKNNNGHLIHNFIPTPIYIVSQPTQTGSGYAISRNKYPKNKKISNRKLSKTKRSTKNKLRTHKAKLSTTRKSKTHKAKRSKSKNTIRKLTQRKKKK